MKTAAWMNPRPLPAMVTILAVLGLIQTLVPSALAQSTAGRSAGNSIETEVHQPEPIRIMVDELPAPFASESAQQHPTVVDVPERAELRVPEGFHVNVYADNVEQARWLALTPTGDVLCSCGRTNTIHLLRDTDDDGVADERSVFLDEELGANLPFGMDFAQVDSQWYFYLGNTDAVLRYSYELGQTTIDAEPQLITSLPGQGYNQHWTRNVRVSPDADHLFVTVGSKSNVDREELPRASVIRLRLDGSEREVFAFGLRNPVGLDFHPQTGHVYVNVNERDKLGDDLVPDYFTRIEKGQFFGWPYAYLRPSNLDPRRLEDGQSERPELAQATHAPDVLYRAHSVSGTFRIGHIPLP